MAETELERRRRILREGEFSDRLKILGYHLGDNLIGFDDEYDTLGERFRTGIAESISNFMGDPVGVSYGALENFAGDIDRAMAGDADPVDYLMLASGAIGGPVGGAAGRVAGKVTTDAADTLLDPVYRRQLRAATGDPESYEWLGDAAFRDVYVPSDIEESMMWGNPDPAQQIYLDRRKLASELLDQGASDRDIFEQTGILHMPIRSVEGDEELGVRAVGFFDPAEGLVEQLRPNRYANITEKFEDLGGNVTGRANYDTREIAYDKSLVPTADDFLETRSHELAHFDLFDSDLPRSETGSSVPYETSLRDLRIEQYENAIENASNDPDYRAFLEKNLRDIKGLTPEENYLNNPGERIARLRAGEHGTARQMSPLEHLNPYLGRNDELGLLERIGNAVRRSRGGPGKYVVVPMTKVPARVSDPGYTFIPK